MFHVEQKRSPLMKAGFSFHALSEEELHYDRTPIMRILGTTVLNILQTGIEFEED